MCSDGREPGRVLQVEEPIIKISESYSDFLVTLLESVLEEAFTQRPIPEAMDVAIGINPFYLAFLAFEFCLRSLARLKDLETEAMLHFKSNPIYGF